MRKPMHKKEVPTYLKHVRAFSRNARFFLASTIFFGFMYGLYYLFFNLYILGLGYDQEFLGVLASIPSLVAAIVAIPVGVLLPRIGYKRSLLVGTFFQMLALLGWVFLPEKATLTLASALFGLGSSLIWISSSPFMVASSTQRERTHLFSIQFGLNTLAGVLASLIGGILPRMLAFLFNLPLEGASTYRGTLLVAGALCAVSLLPLAAIRSRPAAPKADTQVGETHRYRPVMGKLVLTELTISLGAGLLMPFVNVFYKLRFALPDHILGGLFAASSLTMGLAVMLVPLWVKRMGKVKTIVLTQLLSLPFLLLMGFSPIFTLSAGSYLMRTALMNMSAPVLTAFAMGIVPAPLRPITSSLLVLSWNGGWAISAYASGKLQVRTGFSPIFLTTGSLYLLTALLTYRFFHRTREIEETTIAEAVLVDEEIKP